MQSAKRVILVPPKQVGGALTDSVPNQIEPIVAGEEEKSGKVDRIKFKIYDKIHRFIRIILKIAQSDGYDDSLRIKTRDGNFLEKTNIVDLLTHAMSIGKVLHGEEEFIALMAKANVDPDLILNENVKSKLLQYTNQRQKANYIKENEIMTRGNANNFRKRDAPTEEPRPVRKGNKRFIVVNDDKDMELVLSPPRRDDLNEDTERPLQSVKRKLSEDFDDDNDSVDDDQIDSTKWKV